MGTQLRRAAALGLCTGLAALSSAVWLAGTASSTGAFGSAIVVGDQDTGEPGIDLAPDGTVYVNAPAGLLSSLPGSASFVWKKAPGATSFVLTDPGMRADFPGGGDSDIAIDPAGGLHMTDLWLGSATVSRSTDGAQTWTSNPLQGVVVQDRQWIAATANAVYHVTHQIPAGLIASKSIDGGLTFPIHTIAATPLDQTGCVCPPGNLVAEGASSLLGTADKVGVIYATSTGGVNFARSTNGALTFTNVTVSSNATADTGQAFPVVATDGTGGLVATWLEIVGTTSRIQFARSTDWGATWSTPVTLVSTGTSVYPWVAAHGADVIVTLYHTADAVATPGTVPASATWYEDFVESTDGGASWSGLTHVDSTAVKHGPICTEGVNCSGGRELLDFQSVAMDASGYAHAAWTRSLDDVSNTQIVYATQAP